MKHYEVGHAKPEIVLGLAGPIGTDLGAVADKISSELRAYKYETDIIRISGLLKQLCSPSVVERIDALSEDERIDTLMNVGDWLRCELGIGAAAIPAVIEEIRRFRQNFLIAENCDVEFEKIELYNRCYLLNSLKHPDEVSLLRDIYGDKFVLVSVVAPQEVRRARLISKISKSYSTTEDVKFGDIADALIAKDRQRVDAELGQSIGDTFPLADFFLRSDV